MAVTVRSDDEYRKKAADGRQAAFDKARMEVVHLNDRMMQGSDEVLTARQLALAPVLELLSAAKTVDDVNAAAQRLRHNSNAPEVQKLIDALGSNPLLLKLVAALIDVNLDFHSLDGLLRTVQGLKNNTLHINPGTGTVALRRQTLPSPPAIPAPTGAAAVPHQPGSPSTMPPDPGLSAPPAPAAPAPPATATAARTRGGFRGGRA